MKKTIASFIAILSVILVYGQSNSEIKCRKWKPSSFCDVPNAINLPNIFNMVETYEETIDCKTFDDNVISDDSTILVGVWITFPRSMGAEINLADNFKNISLISKTSGDTLHPGGILLPNLHKDENPAKCMYLSPTSLFKKYSLKYGSKKTCDLIMIFLYAEVGDKIIVDNLLQTEITFIKH
jgi:hypothetical protein